MKILLNKCAAAYIRGCAFGSRRDMLLKACAASNWGIIYERLLKTL